MPEKPDIQALSPVFRWWRWPWPEPGDPGPPWETIISHLDKGAVVRLAGVQLDLAKNVLQAQIHAITAAQEIIKGVKG